jgi:hypothetical protein
MVKVLHTPIASLTVFGVLEDMRFADIAVILIQFDIETGNIIALGLGFSFKVDSVICWVNQCSLYSIL